MSYFSTVNLDDVFGFYGHFSPSSALQVAEPYRLVGTTFGTAIDLNFWTPVTSGAAATSTVANGRAIVNSGTASGGYAKFTSVRAARFIIDQPHKFRAVIRTSNVTIANTYRAWGPVSLSAAVAPQNGAFFSIDGGGVLSINTVTATTVTTVASGSFNGGVASFTLDTNQHIYDIFYSIAGVWFVIDGVLIHKVISTTAMWCIVVDHPINFWSTNSAITGGAPLECWGTAINRLGRHFSNPQIGRVTGVAATYTFKTGSGILKSLVFGNVSGTSVTIYDNTTGAAPIMLIITTAAAAVGVWPLEMPFYTGLTIVTVGNGLDMTVIYE